MRNNPLVTMGRVMCKRKAQKLGTLSGATATVPERDDEGLDQGRDGDSREEKTSRWWN